MGGRCGDAGETTVVTTLSTALSTDQSFRPSDAVTVTVANGEDGDLLGRVRLTLFVGTSDCDAGTASATWSSGWLEISGGTGTGLARTWSVTSALEVSAGTTLSWRSEYESYKPAQRSIPPTCHERMTYQIVDGVSVASP